MLVVYVALLGVTGYGLSLLPSGFIPLQDQGYLVVNVTLPDGASLERTEKVMKRITDIALGPVLPGGDRDKTQAISGIDHITAVAGYSVLRASEHLQRWWNLCLFIAIRSPKRSPCRSNHGRAQPKTF